MVWSKHSRRIDPNQPFGKTILAGAMPVQSVCPEWPWLATGV
jgi:hypothetical protein